MYLFSDQLQKLVLTQLDNNKALMTNIINIENDADTRIPILHKFLKAYRRISPLIYIGNS